MIRNCITTPHYVVVLLGQDFSASTVTLYDGTSKKKKNEHIILKVYNNDNVGQEQNPLPLAVVEHNHMAHIALEDIKKDSDDDDDDDDDDTVAKRTILKVEVWRGTDDQEKLMGIAFIVLDNATKTSSPLLSSGVPIMNNSSLLGVLTYHVVYCTPFRHISNDIEDTPKPMLPKTVVVHRGFGEVSLSVNQPSSRAGRSRVRENTIASVHRAAEKAVDFIEFDVQLTRDHVPVVFHDFTVNMQVVDRCTTRDEIVSVPLGLVTARQLNVIRITENRVSALKGLILKHWSTLVAGVRHRHARSYGSAFIPYDIHTATVTDEVPTFERFLHSTPSQIGFNVEVKFPLEVGTEDTLLGLGVYRDLNSYVDSILRVTFDHAKERRVIFSTFHPDIAVLLRLKQRRYPVMFLTEAGTNLDYSDARCLSIDAAREFAVTADLLGVVCYTVPLLEKPDFIRTFKESKKWLWTWGKQNNNGMWAAKQYQLGVDAVISDVPTVEDIHTITSPPEAVQYY
eukprot:PhM_4_TR1383/c0_g1_i1/m.12791/K18695/GPCPD1; glycerophosphocholine phosphodiesterase GPCPD1